MRANEIYIYSTFGTPSTKYLFLQLKKSSYEPTKI